MTVSYSKLTSASAAELPACDPISESVPSRKKTRLFVGIGSPHGDDQAGWTIAEGLLQDVDSSGDIIVRRASVPLDLIDWLDGIDCLHVCDACQGDAPPGTLHRWEYKAATPAASDRQREPRGRECFASLRSTGSHDFGLIAVLELADRLGRLPSQVVVWCIEGRRFEIGQTLSPEIVRILPEVKGVVAHALSQA
jgi:hydrogenase maturation protease